MKVVLKKDSYKGTDGSSLSKERCSQIIKLFEFAKSLGKELITYKTLQSKALEQSLYGATASDKALRTFCPLLSKLGFINYEGNFIAEDLFTKDGQIFIQIIKTLEAAYASGNSQLIHELEVAKQKSQRLGLLQMWENPKYKQHNIWVAIALLQEVGEIVWSEFPYVVYLYKEQGLTVDDIIAKLENDREEDTTYDYYKEDGTKLASTVYTYIHSFLLEAGIIEDCTTGYSTVCDVAEEFLNMLK